MSVTFINNAPAVLAAEDAARARALEIIGGKAEGYAKRLCPTKTGRLKNSITHQQMDEHTEVIGTSVEYAAAVELGHHQEPGRYVPAIGKRLKKSFVPGKPFLRPAAENHTAEYKAIIQNVMKNG